VLTPDHPEHRFVLFVQPKDREREVWTGWRAGDEGAKRDYGADAAFTIDKLDAELPKLAEKADRVYYRFGGDPAFDERLVGFMRRFQRQRQREGTGPTSVIDPRRSSMRCGSSRRLTNSSCFDELLTSPARPPRRDRSAQARRL